MSGRESTGRLNVVGPALPAEFVTETAIEVVATAEGTPLRTPDAEMLAQLGSPVALQVHGPVPDARNWNEYPVPTIPVGSGELDVIAGPTPLTVSEKVCGPADPALFVAVTSNAYGPVAVGVPDRIPVDGLRLSPGGGCVEVQESGVEPDAANPNEYATPTVPPGSGLVLVIVGGIALVDTTRENVTGPVVPTEFVAVIAGA